MSLIHEAIKELEHAAEQYSTAAAMTAMAATCAPTKNASVQFLRNNTGTAYAGFLANWKPPSLAILLITLTTAGSYAGSYGYSHYSGYAAHESALKTQAAASTTAPEHPALATAPTSLSANQTNQTNQPDQILQAAQTLQTAPASSSAQNAPVSARNLAAIETDKQPVPTTSSQWMRDHRPTPIKLAVSTHSPDSADANLTSIVTAPTVTPAATPIDQTTSPASSASTPPDAIQNPLTVEQHYTRFTQALSRNELNIAQTHLNALATLLPQESISLLRARAWYFSQAQDTSSARTTYEAILKRLPGDENAGLNLAALEAQAGRLPRAHSLLADVLRQHPDSVQAQQMRARLQEGRR